MTAGVIPAQLSVEAMRPCPMIDHALPVADRVRLFDEWVDERALWVARRAAHSDAVGWPGGDVAREEEEQRSRPIPDGPFDPGSV